MYDTIPINDSVIYLVQKAVQDTVFVNAQSMPTQSDNIALKIAIIALIVSLIPIVFDVFKTLLLSKPILHVERMSNQTILNHTYVLQNFGSGIAKIKKFTFYHKPSKKSYDGLLALYCGVRLEISLGIIQNENSLIYFSSDDFPTIIGPNKDLLIFNQYFSNLEQLIEVMGISDQVELRFKYKGILNLRWKEFFIEL